MPGTARRARGGRREEHSTEDPAGIAPHGLIRDREKHAGVTADEETEYGADGAPHEAGPSAQHAGDRSRHAEPSDLGDRAEERNEREQAEDEQRPRAETDRGLRPERDTAAARVHKHVPEAKRAALSCRAPPAKRSSVPSA